MDEYIKKSDIGLTDFEIILCKGDYKEALLMLFDKIEHLPAADVRPVVRGNWIKHDDDAIECSVCGLGLESFIAGVFFRFCPFCGAKMDGEA